MNKQGPKKPDPPLGTHDNPYITAIEGYVMLVWFSPAMGEWLYTVRQLIVVRGVIIDVRACGGGARPTQAEAEDAVQNLYDQMRAKEYVTVD